VYRGRVIKVDTSREFVIEIESKGDETYRFIVSFL